MKKTLILFIAIMLGSLINAFPQGINWKLGGNGNVGTNDYIGPVNAADMSFLTDNIVRFIIDKNGNIIVNSFTGNNTGIVCYNQNGVLNKLDFSGNAAQYLTGDGNFKDISAFAGWQLDHNNLYSVPSGNVGIGVSNPTEKLDVDGNIRTTGTVYANGGLVVGTFKQGIAIVTTSLGVGTNSPTQQIDVVGNIKASGTVYADLVRTDSLQLSKPLDLVSLHVDNKIKVGNSIIIEGYDPIGPSNKIYTDDFNGTGNNDLKIQCSNIYTQGTHNTIINASNIGGVGIGALTPYAKLDVRIPVLENSVVAMFKNTSNDGVFIVPHLGDGGVNPHSVAGDVGLFWDGFNPTSGLVIGPWQAGWAGMRITHDGNIGIGTNNPIEKLHLQSGNVFINSENAGLIVDEGSYQRVGFMKYSGKQAGIWRVPSQGFEIGRVTGTLKAPASGGFTTDLFISGDGRVGIGTDNPQATLHVLSNGKNTCTNLRLEYNYLPPIPNGCSPGSSLWDIAAMPTNNLLFTSNNSQYPALQITEAGSLIIGGTDLVLGKYDGKYQGTQLGQRALVHDGWGTADNLIINYAGDFEDGVHILAPFGYPQNTAPSLMVDGKVGIGVNSTTDMVSDDFLLFVQKGILTERCKVAVKGSADWSDFVLDKKYKLMPLNELEAYIDSCKHLPDVPSASEVIKTGIDVAKMDALLLQKIEELTLYVIELKKENEQQQKQILELQNKK